MRDILFTPFGTVIYLGDSIGIAIKQNKEYN